MKRGRRWPTALALESVERESCGNGGEGGIIASYRIITRQDMFHRLRHICCWRRGHRIFVCKWREQRARQGVICRKKASLVLVGGPASRRHHRSTNPNPAISFLFYFLDYKVGVGGARQQKANWRLFWRHHATGPGTLVRCSYRAMPLPPFNLRPTDAMDVWDVCEAR